MKAPRRLVAIAIAACVLLVGACGDDDDDAASGDGGPQVGEHVHDAYGIYLCDQFLPALPDAAGDPLGIHTHADGLIHIHPFVEEAAGDRATLTLFLDDIGVSIDGDTLALPNVAGDAPCDGTVQIAVWDDANDPEPTISTNPDDVPLRGDQLITIAFVPAGTEIPKPPSADRLQDPGDI